MSIVASVAGAPARMTGSRSAALLDGLTNALATRDLSKDLSKIVTETRDNRERRQAHRRKSDRQAVHARPQPGRAPAKGVPLRGERGARQQGGRQGDLGSRCKKEPFDVEARRARLDALGARDVLPDGLPDDPPLEPDDSISFD
ncbi:hypothetical protein [Methylosinus sp. Sm6]|uniref:hypothetical protein n=1 Tax=Methylosinus sp. Sm6 TaxID=2866948 RepID=UPI00351CFFDB